MNLLQSLALRTIEMAPAIEPPRVPFVSVFPEEPVEGVDTARPAPEPPRAGVLPEPPARTRPGAALPVEAHSKPGPERAPVDAVHREASREPRDPGAGLRPIQTVTPRVSERTIERRVEVSRRSDETRQPASEPRVPAADAEPPAIVRHEVHETHHHHWVEPPPVVHRVEHVTTPARAVDEAPARPPRAPVAPPRRVEPAAEPPLRRPGVLAEPQDPRRRESPAPAQPVVHVAIGRVTVRVQQPPPAAASTPTTRPVPPALDLDTYTASRRRGRR